MKIEKGGKLTSQPESRSQSLKPLLQAAVGDEYTDELLVQLLSAEDEMTENREHLSILNQREIISDQEFYERLDMCFMTFIKRVSEFVGPERCRLIYDYAPSDEINLANMSSKESNYSIEPMKVPNQMTSGQDYRGKARPRMDDAPRMSVARKTQHIEKSPREQLDISQLAAKAVTPSYWIGNA